MHTGGQIEKFYIKIQHFLKERNIYKRQLKSLYSPVVYQSYNIFNQTIMSQAIRESSSHYSDSGNQKSSSQANQDHSREKKNLKNSGTWKIQEQTKYTIFLQYFKEDLQSKHKRKFNKIFKLMSEYLGTRDAIQCRSHHMKQLRTLKKIKNIIKETKKRVGDNEYRELYDQAIENELCFKLNSRLLPQESPFKKEEFETKEVGIQTIDEEPEFNYQEQPSQMMIPIVLPASSIVLPVWPFSQNYLAQNGYY